jgi:hypothetical protein
MPKITLKKEKWALSFDGRLKRLVIREAKKKGVYPVNLLEQAVRNQFNPYGHTDIEDSVAYVKKIRKGSRSEADEAFLKEIRTWQRLNS